MGLSGDVGRFPILYRSLLKCVGKVTQQFINCMPAICSKHHGTLNTFYAPSGAWQSDQ